MTTSTSFGDFFLLLLCVAYTQCFRLEQEAKNDYICPLGSSSVDIPFFSVYFLDSFSFIAISILCDSFRLSTLRSFIPNISGYSSHPNMKLSK